MFSILLLLFALLFVICHPQCCYNSPFHNRARTNNIAHTQNSHIFANAMRYFWLLQPLVAHIYIFVARVYCPCRIQHDWHKDIAIHYFLLSLNHYSYFYDYILATIIAIVNKLTIIYALSR